MLSLRLTAFLSGCTMLIATASAAIDAPLVIEPLGDSITYGYSTESAVSTPGGYREPLYEQLKQNGVAIDYVGAATANPGPTQLADNQVEHDGYPKYTISEVYQNLDGKYDPP